METSRRPTPLLLLLVPILLLGVVLGGCTGTPAPQTATAPADEAVPERPLPQAGKGSATEAADTVAEVTLLHFNDVYEITPLQGGRVGGLARVATLRDRLLAENPHLLTTLGGDFLSPSAMGTAMVDGERLAGRQMVDVLEAVGLDVATFGNHEFDLGRSELLERLGEIDFLMVGGNVELVEAGGGTAPFPDVPQWAVFTLGEPEIEVGVLGVVLPDGAPEYVEIADPLETLRRQAAELRDRVDVLIVLTHLDLAQDGEAATTIPEIDLILGGHEHENWEIRRGGDLTPVLKADANVRTIFVVELAYDTATGELAVEPRLVPVTDAIPEQPETAVVVERWTEAAFEGFRENGFEPEAVVAEVQLELDGREAVVRNRATRLTDLIAEAMLDTVATAEAAVYNAGSIRIDDVLPPGPVSQYDVIRILPFGGDLVEVEIAGGLLWKVLDQGLDNRGTGGYLHHAGIERTGDGTWLVGGEPLSERRTYRVVLTDFLLSGRETGLDYLMPGHPDLQILSVPEDRVDVRRAVIEEIEQRYGGTP